MLNLSGMPLDQNHMGTQARLNRMRRNARKAKQLREDVEAWKATPVADKRKALSRGMGSRNVLAKKGGKRRRTRKLRKSRRKNRRKSRRKSRKSNRRRTRRRRHRR